jgi:LEA14-like dessication related protein
MRIDVRFLWVALLSVFLFSGCAEVQELKMKRVDGFKVKSITTRGVEVELSLSLYNPNNRRFKLKKVDLDMAIGRTTIGKAFLRKKVVVKKNSTETYTFVLYCKFGQLAKGALPLITGIAAKGPAEVKLNGMVKVSTWGISKKIPVDVSQRLSLRDLL